MTPLSLARVIPSAPTGVDTTGRPRGSLQDFDLHAGAEAQRVDEGAGGRQHRIEVCHVPLERHAVAEPGGRREQVWGRLPADDAHAGLGQAVE